MSLNYNLLEPFVSYHTMVRAELKEIIDSNSSTLYNMLRYHMGWQDKDGNPCHERSGKFIRSTLCLLSCHAVGGDISRILSVPAALELIHNFSLIHDDIQDASDERHHRPTVWKLWGQAQAINAGDAMFNLAYSALLRLKRNDISDQKVVGSIKLLEMACRKLCEGQYSDMEYASRLDVTVEDYLNMAANKTAALIAASTSVGAYLGCEDEKMVEAFRLFGRELGMAYQISDDILGIWGMEEITGKSASDISQRKKTLPVVYGLQNSNGEAGKKLEEFYLKESIADHEVGQIVEILDNLGAKRYAQSLTEQYHHQALTLLDSVDINASSQASLRELVSFLLERDY